MGQPGAASDICVPPIQLQLDDLLADQNHEWRVVGSSFTIAVVRSSTYAFSLFSSLAEMRRHRATAIVVLSVIAFASTAAEATGWALWKHSYEVWVDGNKTEHRREVAWNKVAKSAAKSDCESRRVSEARAEYHELTGKGIRATLAGSKVGFEQRNTRFRHGYRTFECWPDTVDPRGPKAK